MNNNIMTMISESTNVIICIMVITTVMWWVNDKNIFPLSKCFIEKSTDSIFNLRHAFSILNSHIYPTFNKTNGKASTPTLLKLFCHCVQDVYNTFIAEKQNKMIIYESFLNLVVITLDHLQNMMMCSENQCGYLFCIFEGNQPQMPISILLTFQQCWYKCQIRLQNFHVHP